MALEANDFAKLVELDDVYDARKPWWKSRRMWGLLIIAGAAAWNQAAGYYGWPQMHLDLGALSTTLDGLIEAIGFAVAWWGAVRATRPISLRKVMPGVTIPSSGR